MSDPIDRQEAIDALDDELTITGKTNAIIVKDYVRRVANKIKKLPPAQSEQQWIPVIKKLPKDGKWCLFTDGVNMSVERYKADAIDHFFPEGRWFRLEDAVAWMPLPEPYEGEKGEEE